MKRVLLSLISAFAACVSLAETRMFDVKGDRADCLYRCGETASFSVTVRGADGRPATNGWVNLTVDNFGPKEQQKAQFNLAYGNPFKVSGALAEPGFLRLTFRVPGEQVTGNNGKPAPTYVWGVAYEPAKIVKGSPSPDDFDAFWAAARAKLAREVPADVRIVRMPERCTAQFEFSRISFATFGRRVYGYLSVPTDRTKAPYPVDFSVAAAGFGNWTNDMPGSPDAIRMHFSVYPFAPDPNWAKSGLKKEYDALNAACLAKCGTGYAQSGMGTGREQYFFYPVLLGIDRAVDWLAARDDVDGTRFRYQGTSQGGGFGFYLTGLNRHFTRAAFFVPAITDTMGYRAGRQSGWPQVVEGNSRTPAQRAEAERNAPYFDGANFAARIRCPVRVGVGFADTTCPPCAVYAAYNAIPVADKGIVHGFGMGHSVRSEIYGKLSAWVRGETEKK